VVKAKWKAEKRKSPVTYALDADGKAIWNLGGMLVDKSTFIYITRNELALRGLHDKERFYEYALRVIDQLTVDQLERLREHINRRLGA
jgi:hypothetical protein